MSSLSFMPDSFHSLKSQLLSFINYLLIDPLSTISDFKILSFFKKFPSYTFISSIYNSKYVESSSILYVHSVDVLF